MYSEKGEAGQQYSILVGVLVHLLRQQSYLDSY